MNQDSISPYYNLDTISGYVEEGRHRECIGGLWDELGQLQFDFMKSQGLSPQHRLLDVGCGCLRGGVYFVDYLEPGHYFGTDMNQSLLDSGYKLELAEKGLQQKMPVENLICDADFDYSKLNTRFDHALAVSVFTHLPLNLIRVCLEKLAGTMKENGQFYATFFERQNSAPSWQPQRHEIGNITTFGDKDPYHYGVDDFEHLIKHLPWKLDYIGDIGHPRNQKMLKFSVT